MSKDVNERTGEKQTSSAMHLATRPTLELESFIEKITQRILKDENIHNSLTTYAKGDVCHVIVLETIGELQRN